MMQKIYEVKIINYSRTIYVYTKDFNSFYNEWIDCKENKKPNMSLDVQKIKTALDQYFNSENV
jgi:hypothetical protein